jgi:hypothetical protein
MLLVFSVTGVIPNMLNRSLTTLNLRPRLLSVQEVAVPNICYIARKFLNVEAHLSDAEADNP